MVAGRAVMGWGHTVKRHWCVDRAREELWRVPLRKRMAGARGQHGRQ
jgi:hypothetical protein